MGVVQLRCLIFSWYKFQAGSVGNFWFAILKKIFFRLVIEVLQNFLSLFKVNSKIDDNVFQIFISSFKSLYHISNSSDVWFSIDTSFKRILLAFFDLLFLKKNFSGLSLGSCKIFSLSLFKVNSKIDDNVFQVFLHIYRVVQK